MSYDPEFDELLSETVTLVAHSSTDEHGARTPGGAPKTVKARSDKVKAQTVFRDKQGRVLRGARVWYLKPTDTAGDPIAPTTASQLTLPAGHDPQTPRILGVQPVTDEDGIHHYEVLV